MPWHTMPKQGLSCVLLICWITLAHCTTCVHKIYCDPGCEGSCTGYNAKLVFRNVLTRKSFKLHILERKGFISRGSSGLRNYFVWQNCGGVRVQFSVLEFLQHSLYRYSLLCTYCTNSRRRFDSAGGIALRTATAAAAKAAAGALWQPGGRAGPGTLTT